MKGARRVLFISCLLLLTPLQGRTEANPPIYIRVDQIGYLPAERKTALALTDASLTGQSFRVIREAAGDAPHVALTAAVGEDRGPYGKFAHLYALNFQPVTAEGTYRLQIGNAVSPAFRVASDAFSGLLPRTLKFYRVQRCGDADPLLHGPCHRKDGIARGGPRDGQIVDAAGGWHDAGDYIKFLITTGATTDLMLTAYQRRPEAFLDRKSPAATPALLQEARIGLDWMLKLWDPEHQTLYYQVGDASDHNGWRMPEEDDARRPVRPVFACEPGKGGNVAGKAAAALALASVIWSDAARPYHDAALAAKYRTAAKQIYAWGEGRTEAQPSTPDDFYGERSSEDDLALAAAELYRATHDPVYLREARAWADKAGVDGSLNWGSLHALAHYEIARLDPTYLPIAKKRLLSDLSDMSDSANRDNNPFHSALDSYEWSSASEMQGAALEALWYEDLSGDRKYHDLAQDQRDFVLGANPWGVCWVQGCGTTWPHYPHHSAAFVKKTELPGFWDEGPVRARSWRRSKIELSRPDPYAAFQSESAVYHDDREDYMTNEPTLFANALGLALVSWYVE